MISLVIWGTDPCCAIDICQAVIISHRLCCCAYAVCSDLRDGCAILFNSLGVLSDNEMNGSSEQHLLLTDCPIVSDLPSDSLAAPSKSVGGLSDSEMQDMDGSKGQHLPSSDSDIVSDVLSDAQQLPPPQRGASPKMDMTPSQTTAPAQLAAPAVTAQQQTGDGNGQMRCQQQEDQQQCEKGQRSEQQQRIEQQQPPGALEQLPIRSAAGHQSGHPFTLEQQQSGEERQHIEHHQGHPLQRLEMGDTHSSAVLQQGKSASGCHGRPQHPLPAGTAAIKQEPKQAQSIFAAPPHSYHAATMQLPASGVSLAPIERSGQGPVAEDSISSAGQRSRYDSPLMACSPGLADLPSPIDGASPQTVVLAQRPQLADAAVLAQQHQPAQRVQHAQHAQHVLSSGHPAHDMHAMHNTHSTTSPTATRAPTTEADGPADASAQQRNSGDSGGDGRRSASCTPTTPHVSHVTTFERDYLVQLSRLSSKVSLGIGFRDSTARESL